MSRPLEHDYIGLSEVGINSDKTKLSSKSTTFSSDNEEISGIKTELSLGLPGCESPSPERKPGFGVTLFGNSIGSLNTCTVSGAKRGFSDTIDGCEKWGLYVNGGLTTNFNKDGVFLIKEVDNPSSNKSIKEEQPQVSAVNQEGSAPAAKAQVVGWPPIRSFRKNTMASTSTCTKSNGLSEEKSAESECLYVKVSMDGAPYLRKIDLQTYKNYMDFSSALEKLFSCFITGQYASHGRARHDEHELSGSHSTDHLLSSNSEYVLTYEDKDGDWMLVGDVPWKMFTENCRKLRIVKGSEAIG